MNWSLPFAMWLLIANSVAQSADDGVDYVEQIKPILQARCYACHGALKQEAALRLDTAASAIKGGESGTVVVPGDMSSSSELLRRVSTENGDDRMPPSQEGEPLSAEQVELIRRWIAEGAKAPADEQPESDPRDHWSFQSIVRPAVPPVSSGWVRNPIDAFLHQQHQERGLVPQPEAPRITQLRRLYIDLIGVPPTLKEIEECENDPSPQWHEHMVRRLLDDPRHGERWARHWMDVWRYSDWWGLGDQLRNSKKHIWHWRDWIVESLNDDTPYDEMIRLMLAADELHPDDLNRLRATGYLARNYWLFNRPQWMEETVEHVSKGFLGLTVNCARCHDHKYDPIAQTDYYRLRAFFEPYHVRMDMVPGQPNLIQDGIPRAFDGVLDEPTFLYIRGDERNPDKSQVIAPGVPSVLSFEELKVTPVSLPAAAWQPERRQWIIEDQIAVSRRNLDEADSRVRLAQEKLQAARFAAVEIEKKEALPAQTSDDSSSLLLAEKFETLEAGRWKTFGGEWVHSPGKFEQRKDGATTSVARLLSKAPRDFDVSVRLTILGGSHWRSTGLIFDSTQADPSQPVTANDTEQDVYFSAVHGGSKVQAAWNRGGTWQYPGGAAVRLMPIELNREYTLRVQTRDRLINASLDDEPVIAWESPLPRTDGALQLMTFDAIVTFHEVTVRELDSSIQLKMPGEDLSASPQTLKMARLAIEKAESAAEIAEAELVTAKAELECMERRAEAQQAEWASGDSSDPGLRDKAAMAVRADRKVQAARAAHRLLVAEQTLVKANATEKESASKAVTEARQAMVKAAALVEYEVQPSETFARFKGAMWTPTRFLDSGKDDPEVRFPSTSSGRRTALANWITDRRNPLTARVAVNHVWTRHMGQPLVPTMFDFGRKGTPPSNPALLDWLAAEFVESGWSMKHLHTLITNSSAYRMSSSLTGADAKLAQDADNRFYWRRVPVRLESQVIRDSLLSLAGTLDNKMGGPSIPADQQAASTRRSLYFFHSNNERSLFLTMFDEALVKDCYRREQSIVPQQALALSNSGLAFDASQQIAYRLSEDQPDDGQFVRAAFRIVAGIDPADSEIAASLEALHEWRSLSEGTPESARANLIWALINHNDFVTLR